MESSKLETKKEKKEITNTKPETQRKEKKENSKQETKRTEIASEVRKRTTLYSVDV